MTLATLVGLASTLLAFGCTVPQFAKLRTTATAAGVSVVALANSTVSGTAWTLFGVAVRDPWVALPALVTLPATVGALVLAWRRGAGSDGLWVTGAWAATLAAAAAATTVVGPVPLTVVLGGSVTLLVGPAVVTAWRSPDVSAIAASGWLLLVVDGALAAAYGVLAGIDANLLYGAVAATGSVLVLARLAVPADLHARLARTGAAVVALPEPLAREELELVS